MTYANKAAKLHPGHPVEAMGGKQVIKSLANDLNLGKVKLPYSATVELAAGIKVKGDFMSGLSGLDIAFVIKSDTSATNDEPKANHNGLSNIIALLRDELGPPMRKLSGALGSLPESTQTTEVEEANQALDQRLRRLSDLIAVFGDEVLITEDRVELATLVESVCEELRPKALAKKVHFEVVSPTQTLPPLYGTRA